MSVVQCERHEVKDVPADRLGVDPLTGYVPSFRTAVVYFGKHKGKAYEEIPSDYLRWMTENIRQNKIVKLARNELRRRGE